jgi:type II secretory pathway predicted ATPase ExeA
MSLYLEHFGLREPPFRITPHTDFFFTGANRGPTLDALIYAITQDEGIVKVTGEVGSGKTMLCRMLLERLPANVESLYLANPSLSRDELLGAIADDLGIPADGKSTHSKIRALQDALVERYAAGKRVVVLIDEAHAMPTESLEEIRLLSNLESKSAKLLQIALFAQPELDERLAANDMRQLRERITQHFGLNPLKPGDVAGYIDFRLRAAGYHGPTPFTPRAIEFIAKVSEGLSRRINILADKALLAAFSQGSHQVDSAEVRIAAADARFAPLHQRSPARGGAWLKAGMALAAALVAAAAAYALWPGEARSHAGPVTPTPATASAPAPHAPAVQQHGHPAPLTDRHIAQFEAWLPAADPGHWFIQLMARDARYGAEVEAFLGRATASLDPAALLAYRSTLSGSDRLGVIYGDYPNRSAAWAALAALPAEIRLLRPYPRQVSKLQ